MYRGEKLDHQVGVRFGAHSSPEHFLFLKSDVAHTLNMSLARYNQSLLASRNANGTPARGEGGRC